MDREGEGKGEAEYTPGRGGQGAEMRTISGEETPLLDGTWAPISTQSGGVAYSHDATLGARDTGSMLFLLLWSVCPALLALVGGYDVGAIASSINPLDKDSSNTNVEQYFGVNIKRYWEEQILLALPYLAASLAIVIAYVISGKVGRRGIMFLAAGLYIGAGLFGAGAETLMVLACGRFLFGMGLGFAVHSVPLYVGEVTPSFIRGFFVSAVTVMEQLGMLLAFCIALNNNPQPWRLTFGLASIPAAAALLLLLWVPESPRWELKRYLELPEWDALEDCDLVENHAPWRKYPKSPLRTLCRVRRRRAVEVRPEYLDLVAGLKDDRASGNSDLVRHWRRYFSSWRMLHALLLCLMLIFFQQMSGVPSLMLYITLVLDQAGVTSADSRLYVSIAIAAVKLLTTMIINSGHNRGGRRTFLLSGTATLVVAASCMAVATGPGSGTAWGTQLFVASLAVFVGAFHIGYGSMTWILIVELFPNFSRSPARSLCVLCDFLGNFLVAGTFVTLQSLLTIPGLYTAWAVFSAISCVVIWLLVPETRGLSADRIEKLMASKVFMCATTTAVPMARSVSDATLGGEAYIVRRPRPYDDITPMP